MCGGFVTFSLFYKAIFVQHNNLRKDIMLYNKRYTEMNEIERSDWLGEFQAWLVTLPEIDSPGAPLEKIFREGIRLLKVFPYCKNFAEETLRVKDYHRRKKALQRLAEKVTSDVEKRLGRKVNYKNPVLLKRHVGRPTKAEAAARAILEKEKHEEALKAPNLFNSVGNKKENLIPPPAFPPAPKGRTISEIRWLLSPQMQEEADSIYRLRANFEEECTIAKQMAEDGREAEDIAPHTHASARYLAAVHKIYDRIDHELCVVYVRLKEDSAYIDEMATKSQYDNKQLRTLLRPYWDKLSQVEKEAFRDRVIGMITQNDPVQAKERKKQEEKKKKANAILKYLRRTDRAITAKRISTMEQKLIELTHLIGPEAENYRPLLISAKEYYEQNINPTADNTSDEEN